MKKTNKKFEPFLTELLSKSTAPFREGYVMKHLVQFFNDNKVPFFQDACGNLIVNVASHRDYLKRFQSRQKNLLFIAHLDHPGFHGVQFKDGLLEAEFLGGAPYQGLEEKAVWLSYGYELQGRGVIKKVELNQNKNNPSRLWLALEESLPVKQPKNYFGGFWFGNEVWKEGEVQYARGCDDLVGASVIAWLSSQLKNKNWVGLLSRAEEVGFIGTLGHFKAYPFLKYPSAFHVVSLETSRELPGAEIGKGPIVRLGDRASIFSASLTEKLHQLAEKNLKGKYQKRIMDGGTCEATVAVTHGLECTGISVPLGNYHNQNFKEGLEKGPGPEYVHLGDVAGMMTLCQALIEAKEDKDPFKARRLLLMKHFSKAEKKLSVR